MKHRNLLSRWFPATLLLVFTAACTPMAGVTAGPVCCESNADCLDGYQCSEGQCAAQCVSNADCNSGATCSAAGLCAVASNANNPCRGNTVGGSSSSGGNPADAAGPSDSGAEDVPIRVRDGGSPDRNWPDEDAGSDDDAGEPADSGPLPDGGTPDGSVRPDSGPLTDGGGPVDAGGSDAGGSDAGRPDAGGADGGRPDAGRPDAGSTDAGRPDAGGNDAGSNDAGRPDAGRPDAGGTDAGRPDAGRPDSGADGGFNPCNPLDAFEPNNTPGTATNTMSSSFQGQVCGGDQDWVVLGTASGGSVSVTVDVFGGSDITVQITNATGTTLAVGTPNSAGVLSAFVMNAPGPTRLRVASNAVATVFWAARVTIQPPDICTADMFEPNNSVAQATEIVGGVTAGICPMDNDFFRFRVPVATSVTVQLTGAPDSGNLDLSVLNAGGQTLGLSQGNTAQESIVLTLQPGTYVARVFAAPTVRGNYTLSVNLGATCTNDSAEPNNTLMQAQPVVSPFSGILCDGDVDFLVMQAGAGGATLTVDGSAWSVRVANLNNQTLLTRNGMGTAQLTIPANNDLILVEVRSVTSGSVPYRLTLTPVVQVCTGADAFEPNNTLMEARFIDTGAQGAVCAGDVDHFAFPVGGGGQVGITVSDPLVSLSRVQVVSFTTGAVLATATRTGTQWTANVTTMEPLVAVIIQSAANTPVDYVLTITPVTPTCTDDSSEPNDSFQAAGAFSGTGSFVICPSNVDFFRIEANAGDTIRISMVPMTQDDLDMELLDRTGRTVARSQNGPPNPENINVTAALAGPFVLRVYGFSQGANGPDQGPYSLTVTVTPVASCAEDGLEQNDSLMQPTRLSPGSLAAATSCPGDVDVFGNFTAVMGSVTWTLRWQGGASLTLRALDNTGMVVGEVTGTGGTLTLSSNGGVPTFATVLSSSPATGTPYTLDLSTGPVVCTGADAQEPNNTAAQASPYVSPQMSGAVCSGDEDWFLVGSTAGETVTALVSSTGGTPQVDIRNQAGQVIATGGPLPGGGFGALAQNVTGPVRVRITSNGAAEVRYTLVVNRVGTNTCVPDNFEPNETPATARPITGTIQAQICANDRDNFVVTTQRPGARISVQLLSQPGGGNLDVRLQNAAGQTLAQGSNGAGQIENVSAVVGAAGRYIITVYGAPEGSPNAGQAPYLLSVTVTETAACMDDGFEDNDSAGNASGLTPDASEQVDGVLCGTDQDWFAKDLSVTSDLNIVPFFANGQVRVTVQDQFFTTLFSQVVGPNQQVFLPQQTPGTYFIGLSSNVAAGLAYALSVEVVPIGPQCNQDNNEPNDDPFSAVPVPTGGTVAGVICQGQDVDFFQVSTVGAATIRVVLNTMRPNADIDLGLLDQDFQTLIASSLGQAGSARTLVADVTNPGPYTLAVFDASQQLTEGVDYTFTVTVTQATSCVEDGFEDNDSNATATSQTINATVTARSCLLDDDFFAYTLQRGVQHSVTLGDALGRMDGTAQVVSPNGQVLGTATSNGGAFRFTPPTRGRYVVRVSYSASPPTGVPYRITLSRP